MSHKRVFALLTPEIHSYEMAQMLQKPVFALPGCQRTSVNTLLCDTFALAEIFMGKCALLRSFACFCELPCLEHCVSNWELQILRHFESLSGRLPWGF